MALTMNAGGRELLFRFTVRAWVEIEEKLGSLNRLLERIDSDDAPLTALITLSAATATAGNRYRGITERVTEDDLIDNLSPMQIKLANRMAKTALTIGMRREEAGAGGGLDVRVRRGQSGQVLRAVRREEARRRAAVPLRQVRLQARRSGASAEILPGVRRSV